MTKQKLGNKRLQHSLLGNYHELLAAYHRSAAHKLPSAKGKIREDAVAGFISSWLPANLSVTTGAFVVSKKGLEHKKEIDLIVHDSALGSLWHLDAAGANSVATAEHVRLIVEVKSSLNKENI